MSVSIIRRSAFAALTIVAVSGHTGSLAAQAGPSPNAAREVILTAIAKISDDLHRGRPALDVDLSIFATPAGRAAFATEAARHELLVALGGARTRADPKTCSARPSPCWLADGQRPLVVIDEPRIDGDSASAKITLWTRYERNPSGMTFVSWTVAVRHDSSGWVAVRVRVSAS